MQEVERQEVERWFRRRGLPLLIEGRSADKDVWTRALPFLVFVFLLQAFNALKWDWPVWANVLAVVGGFALLVGFWMLINVARGRPPASLPERVGLLELAVFVIVPALLPTLFGTQLASAASIIVANLLLLGLVYVVVDLGLISMTRWGFLQLGWQFGDVLAVVVRALPLLLLFVTFLFINAEAWQVASSLSWVVLAIVGGLFFVIGALFATLRVPRQISELSQQPDPEVAEVLLSTTPLPLAAGEAPADHRPLERRQWGNVGLVILVSEGVQVLLVTVMLFLFFSLFGFLAIGGDEIASWTETEAEVIWTLEVGDQEFVLTEQLLKVAVFLAAFSGLYYTVSILTDATYRKEFLDDIVEEVQRSILVRDRYLDRLDAQVL